MVLLALANCHNEATGRCNPSVNYIHEKTALNRKTVMAALKELEEKKLISTDKCSGNSTRYALSMSESTGTKNGTGIEGESGTKSGTADAVESKDSSTKNGTATRPKNGTGTKNSTGTKNGTRTSTKNGTQPVPKTVPKSKKKLKENLKVLFDPLKMVFPDGMNLDAWVEWVDYRKTKRKPISEIAAKKQINFLIKFDWESQAQIIDQSIQNDYQGLFPPKGGNYAKNQSGQPAETNRRPSLVERVEANCRAREANRERQACEGAERTLDGEVVADHDSHVRT